MAFLVLFLLFHLSSSSLSDFPNNVFFERRVLLYGPNNSSGTFGLISTPTRPPEAEARIAATQSRRLDVTPPPSPPPPLLDKLDLRLEAGAKRWQAALNASLGDITPLTTTLTPVIINATSVEPMNHLLPPNLPKANEIAHSEPLKTNFGHLHNHHHHNQNHHPHSHHHRNSNSSKKKKKVQISSLDAEESSATSNLDEDSELSPLDFDDPEDLLDNSLAGSSKAPACATASGKHYCSFKEPAYPADVVAKIVQYYRYPLQSLFGTALSQQVMPQLANDSPSNSGSVGGLVCEATTRLIRVGWAMNTSGRWLAVLNTDHYQQYVTEVLCGRANSACHYVPPCYQATCTQRYNTQKLLVIDPAVPHRGPFLSEFLFPSCCVCHVKVLAGDSKSSASKISVAVTKNSDQRKKA